MKKDTQKAGMTKFSKEILIVRQELDSLMNGLRCYYCDRHLIKLRYIHTVVYQTIDHIIPKSKGGTNSNYNKLWCCNICNSLKGNSSLEGFRRDIEISYNPAITVHRNLMLKRIDELDSYIKKNRNKMFNQILYNKIYSNDI